MAIQPAANILLVDDHPANLLALEATLEGLGQRLVQARSGEAALKLLGEQDFAVVLLDVQMPGLDGFETARRIRQEPRSRHTPIIFLTAVYRDPNHELQGYAVGAIDYLTKPFAPAMLKSKVAGLVDLWQELQVTGAQAARREAVNILEKISDGFLEVDHDWRVTYYNPEADHIFSPGLTGNDDLHGSELLAKVLWEIFPVGTSAYDSCRRSVAEQASVRFDYYVLLLHAWLDVRIFPSPQGVSIYFRDVTQRRQHKRELEERERQFHALAEGIPQLVWMADSDGQVFWYNRRWYDYTGATMDDMKGLGWQSVHDPAELPRAVDRWKVCINNAERFEMVLPLKGEDGVFRPFLTQVVPVLDDDGRVTRWFGTNTDISEARRFEEQLRANEEQLRNLAADLTAADQRKDEFLATLAHELRNPLAPLSTGLQVMKLAADDAGGVERVRTMMERQLAQLVRLVDDLLDVSRITRGQLELRREHVALSAVLDSALETSRPLIEASAHVLEVDISPTPIYLDADLTRLAQAVSNLLNNAARYTERGGRIILTARLQGAEVVVTVTDTGVGISRDNLPRIFDMFTQLDRSLERSQGGLGIGLTLVKRLVELHGGTIEARSAGAGLGSEFVMRLPVSEVPTERWDPRNHLVGQHVARRVMVVDDNRDAVESLAELLELLGHQVVAAQDGQAALVLAATFEPEVVLLDIGLPRLNGYEVCRHLRELPGGDQIFIVALTGWGQAEDRRRATEAKFDLHLVKPVDPVMLGEILSGPSS